jgi:hypothetical protein
VQQIRRRRLTPEGVLVYLTQWEEYPAAEATWEPAASFAGCKDLLDAFNNRCKS